MLDAKLMREDAILVLIPSDTLSETDFERLRLLVDPYFDTHDTLNGVMLYVDSFPGWTDFVSLLAEFPFIDDHQSRIKRVAAVTDSNVLSILPQISNHFVTAEVRHFHYRDHQRAMAWLRDGVEPGADAE